MLSGPNLVDSMQQNLFRATRGGVLVTKALASSSSTCLAPSGLRKRPSSLKCSSEPTKKTKVRRYKVVQ